jgi:hypothetical protein
VTCHGLNLQHTAVECHQEVSSCKSTEEEQQSTKDKVTKYTQKNRNDPKECASLSSMSDNGVRKGSDVVGAVHLFATGRYAVRGKCQQHTH